MAQHTVVPLGQLEQGFILVAERYDPRKSRLNGKGTPISDIASIVREHVTASSSLPAKHYLVFDTGDAKEGMLTVNRQPITGNGIGSAKKLFKPGDVIISRLRPYLRQVAYIDSGIYAYFTDEPLLACSTEFYVLRPHNTEDIAFLVPFLLASTTQEILSSSQEGGHHPRFNQDTLEKLRIPKQYTQDSKALSAGVRKALESIRKGDVALKRYIGTF